MILSLNQKDKRKWGSKTIVLNKKSQAQRTTECTVLFIQNVQIRQIYRDPRNQWLLWAEECWREMEVTAKESWGPL